MVAFRASLDGSAAFGEFEQVALDHSDLVAEFDGVDGVEAVVEGSVLGWGERVGVVAKEPVGWVVAMTWRLVTFAPWRVIEISFWLGIRRLFRVFQAGQRWLRRSSSWAVS